MNLFFSNNIEEEIAILNEEESYHALRVLRMAKGDEIFFVDGIGGFYKGKLIDVNSKKSRIKILERKILYGKRNYYLHIAIAPTKNIERFEWFLEKSTEIGIDEITPVICQHSERKAVKIERLNKVILSAMKQSLKAYLPKLNESVLFEDLLKKHQSNKTVEDAKFVCAQSANVLLKNKSLKESRILMLIGPEGDFSFKEIETATNKNFIPVSLGESRLRTETAGVVSTVVANMMNQ